MNVLMTATVHIVFHLTAQTINAAQMLSVGREKEPCDRVSAVDAQLYGQRKTTKPIVWGTSEHTTPAIFLDGEVSIFAPLLQALPSVRIMMGSGHFSLLYFSPRTFPSPTKLCSKGSCTTSMSCNSSFPTTTATATVFDFDVTTSSCPQKLMNVTP